ncbi:hypothetical protein CKAH01_08980 [Colletotrichum kahawae]|uniref:Uncharacterized protein n=1 Tax=Colletotrichum kahawae TaxID=34407 RepID=A0AAD9Y1Y0_COLKA|nr:hypothetical protein CKAH01_08980 [Colletotrichum kahawae]
MADKIPKTGEASFSAIILAGDQTMRMPTVRYENNNVPVRVYLNFCDSLNLREFTINVFPGRQQISAEFAMTGMQEIEARKNEFQPTIEAIERMRVAKLDRSSVEVEGQEENAAIKVDDIPLVAGAATVAATKDDNIDDEASMPQVPRRSLRSLMKNRTTPRPESNSSSSAAPMKRIDVAKSESTPSRVLRSKYTLERIATATAMPQAPHRGFSMAIDRPTRSPDVNKKPKATKAGVDAAMHVLRNGKITGLRPTVSKRQCHGDSEPESTTKATKIRAVGKGEGGTQNIHSKPSSLASHRPNRIGERGWT